MAVADALFDIEPAGAPAPAPKLTDGEIRRQRQLACAAQGQHPLVAALRTSIRLHPNAAPATDRTAPGLRCGTCVHRVVPWREVAGRYPKCAFGGRWERATGGPGTDCAAWFPACVDYERAGGDSRD
jgi:hypothetical protein